MATALQSDNPPPAAGRQPVSRRWHGYGLGLVLILVLAAVLRLIHLRAESPWQDELLTLKHLGAPTPAAFLRAIHDENPALTPAWFLLEYAWGQLRPGSILAQRLLSVSAGLASIGLVYLLAAALFNRRAALIAALLIALNSQHINFSQEIRMYILVFLLAAGAMLTLVYAETGVSLRKPRDARAWWILNAVFNFLLAWTHPFAVLAYIPQGILILMRHWPARAVPAAWGVVHVAFALSAVAWIKYFDIGEIFTRIGWLPAPTVFFHEGRPSLEVLFLMWLGQFRTWHEASWMNALRILQPAASACLVIGALACIAVAVRRALAAGAASNPNEASPPSPLSPRQRLAFLLTWMFAPALALYVLAHLWSPCFTYRYVLSSGAAVAILMGAGIDAIHRGPIRRLLLALVVLPLLMQIALFIPVPLRPDWRSAAMAVETAAPRDIPAAVIGYQNAYALRHFLKRPRDINTEKSLPDLLARYQRNIAEHGAAVALVSDQKETAGRASVKFEQLLREAGIPWRKTTFPASLPVHLYTTP